MAQTVQILRTTTNNPPPTLLPGALSVELGTQTKLWVGSAGGNRLLMSSDPSDIALSSSCVVSATPPANPIPGLLWWDSTGGQLYVRYQDPNSTAWIAAASATGNFLPISGGTLTGPLILAADPAVPLGAATKQYADTKLPLAGGTMTGPLVLAGPPTAALNPASKAYVDAADVAAQNNVGRNLIHNPLFNIQQRGAGPFTFAGIYTLDRWVMNFSNDTGVSVTQSILSDSIRANIGDEAATTCLTVAFTGNAAATAFTLLDQPIEDVRRLGGKTITVSFYAASNAGTPKLGVSFDQVFGSGGSAPVTGAGQSVTLSTTWTRYSLTFTVPSIAGKTINAGNSTNLDFWFSSGTNQATRAGSIGVQSGTINIWGVQLEIGGTMTPLEKPDPQQDLAKCQRFYQTGYMGFSGIASGAANNVFQTQTLVVPMRATPTIVPNYTGTSNINSQTINTAGTSHMNPIFNVPAAGYYYASGTFTAAADL